MLDAVYLAQYEPSGVNGNHNAKIMLTTALVKLLQSLKTAKGAKYRSSSSDSSKMEVVVVRNKDGFAPCRMKDVCSALSALYKLDSVNQLSTQPDSCSSLEVCETCLLARVELRMKRTSK